MNTLQLRVKAITFEAAGINAYDLRPTQGGELPPFTAGAHIDLHLPNGLVRSYSLLNPQWERHRYVIAVNRDPASRGGSRLVHEAIRAGEIVTIGEPRNKFPLAEDAPHSVLIAGGIGVTPLWSMIQRLEELGRSWVLHYCARTREHAALLEPILELEAKRPGRVRLNFDQEPGGSLLDIAGVVGDAPGGTHFYCCGPVPMLGAFEAATAELAPEQVHLEYFAPADVPAATAGGFVVELAKSGISVEVQAGQTILEALLDAGVDAAYSCQDGICGACETKVLEGLPEHRDSVLSKAEQDRNETMMICCSGSRTAKLVLDL